MATMMMMMMTMTMIMTMMEKRDDGEWLKDSRNITTHLCKLRFELHIAKSAPDLVISVVGERINVEPDREHEEERGSVVSQVK